MEEPAVADPPAGQNGRPARPAGKAGPVSRTGAVTVPPWQEGSDASVLPRAHQDLLEGPPAAGGAVRGRGRAGHEEGEGRGPAVEAEAAGRAGLAGRGARRPVHAAGSLGENTETRTVTGP